MFTVTEKGYAKVNLFLTVTGRGGGYHTIDSVVSTIGLYDTVRVRARRDDKITVRMSGVHGAAEISGEENNAYKAAKLFCDRFKVGGVDINVVKRIPIGGGLGGSSADIAATLKAMAKLFKVDGDITPLADALGSDSGYLLSGGLARLTGRGDKVQLLNEDNFRLNLLVVTPDFGITAGEAYSEYDRQSVNKKAKSADDFLAELYDGNIKKDSFYNALYPSAATLNPKITAVNGLIAALSPISHTMTGSGSSFVAAYSHEELCMWARDKLKNKNLTLFVTETLTRKDISAGESKSTL